jgi:hypothetical protein
MNRREEGDRKIRLCQLEANEDIVEEARRNPGLERKLGKCGRQCNANEVRNARAIL